MLAYAAQVYGRTPRIPIVVAMVTRAERTKRVLVLSRTRPMKGIEKTPPSGRAMSKKVLISTALA